MSGCYRCGLSEGSDTRLCETCYRMRFHHGRDVLDLPVGVSPEGLEFSPRMKTVILSSSAVLYIGFLGLFCVIHQQTQVRTFGDARLQYQPTSDHQAIVEDRKSLGSLRTALKVNDLQGPRG
jgi:hypothetical protein